MTRCESCFYYTRRSSPDSTKFSSNRVLHKSRKLYAQDTQPWGEIASLIDVMEWSNLTSQSGSEFFRSFGVSERHISEILNAATRATYNQNADSVNALSAALANVPDVLTITSRGHRQVFENFVKEANATVFLSSQVSAFRMNEGVTKSLMDFESRSRASNGTRTPTRGQ